MESKSSKLPEHSCAHTKGGIYISPVGEIELCCHSQEIKFDQRVSIDDIDDLDAYYNSAYYTQIRKADVRQIDICEMCVSAEKIGQPSLRTMMPKLYADYGINYDREDDSCKIEHLDICFSNLCNQQCMMCGSAHSSRWYKDDAKLSSNKKFKRTPTKYRKWTTKENLDKIKRIIPNLKLLVIKGGEPLIQPEVYDILSDIRENNSDINIRIVSNMQELSDTMLDHICSIKNLQMTISLDSTGDAYNWIRGGDWNKTLSNIEKYVRGCKHIPMFGYANTMNIWSFQNIVEDIKELEEFNARMVKIAPDINAFYNVMMATKPTYVSPFLAPREKRLDLVTKFERAFGMIENDSVQYKSLTLNSIDNILALENEQENIGETTTEHSYEWQQEINTIRNRNA